MASTASSPDALTRNLAVLVAGLAVVLVVALALRSGLPASEGPDRDAAAAMLDLVNEERARHDLTPLTPAEDIAIVAEAWSATMAADRMLEHNDAAGEQVCCWEIVTENIAFSDPYGVWLPGDPVLRTMTALHEALLDSPGHRTNLLDPHVDQVGIGVHVHHDGSVWITQNFRRTRDP